MREAGTLDEPSRCTPLADHISVARAHWPLSRARFLSSAHAVPLLVSVLAPGYVCFAYCCAVSCLLPCCSPALSHTWPRLTSALTSDARVRTVSSLHVL